jgi:hypothetical protein
MPQFNHHNGAIYDVQSAKTVAIMLYKDDTRNAALLAAAPDLLSALESLAELCAGDLLRSCGTQTVNGQRIKARLIETRAAINKAKGL